MRMAFVPYNTTRLALLHGLAARLALSAHTYAEFCSQRLLAGLTQTTRWNETAIAQRANRLVKEAARVWEASSLDADILAQYHTARQEDNPDTGKHAITDHPHLAMGQKREVFQTLR